jgi:hypothetical protein
MTDFYLGWIACIITGNLVIDLITFALRKD